MINFRNKWHIKLNSNIPFAYKCVTLVPKCIFNKKCVRTLGHYVLNLLIFAHFNIVFYSEVHRLQEKSPWSLSALCNSQLFSATFLLAGQILYSLLTPALLSLLPYTHTFISLICLFISLCVCLCVMETETERESD